MMSSIYLPHELVQIIIDELHSDKAALRSCSLVCHSWAACAQRSLFSYICLAPSLFGLSPNPGPSLLTRFHNITSTAPHLLRYVRVLEFDPTNDAVQYLFSDSASLEELRMVNFVGDMSKAEDVITAVLSLPSVTRLTVREGPCYPAQIVPFLRHCPQLQSLTMSRIMIDGLADAHSTDKAIQLRTLAASRLTPEILADLAENVVDATQLRSFTAQFHPFFYDQRRIERSVPIVQNILKAIEGTLENLSLDICLSQPLPQLIDFSRLRSWDLYIPTPKLTADKPYATAEATLQWLLSSLESLEASSLEYVTIQKLPITEPCVQLASRVDRILSKLGNMRQVFVMLCDSPKAAASAKDLFPLLHKRNLLTQYNKTPSLVDRVMEASE
ncbi:hypothetical protein CPB85DRAFT_1345751 [Mucidula mucida]|nr:hypothetical protein CPB85DRAFT_1345751 [Mucidula mucida]